MNGAAGARRRRAAFTLVEVMVALAIFGLVVVMLAQIFGNSTTIISQSDKTMEGLDGAQAVFQQIDRDVSRMVLRDDVDYSFVKNAAGGADNPAGNDVLSFYARSRGLTATGAPVDNAPRPLAVVGYKMKSNAQHQQEFQYGALQIDWNNPPAAGSTGLALSAWSNGSPAQLFTTPNSLPDPDANPGLIPYTVLAPEVIRFEYCFVLKADPNHATPQYFFVPSPAGSPINPLPSQTNLPSATHPNPLINLQNVAAIVVGIVVVDPKTRLMMAPDADLKLAQLFPDAAPNQDLLSLWTPIAMDNAKLQAAGVPARGWSGVHVYQKYFPLPW